VIANNCPCTVPSQKKNMVPDGQASPRFGWNTNVATTRVLGAPDVGLMVNKAWPKSVVCAAADVVDNTPMLNANAAEHTPIDIVRVMPRTLRQS